MEFSDFAEVLGKVSSEFNDRFAEFNSIKKTN